MCLGATADSACEAGAVIVVAGAGLAGLQTVVALRSRGYVGQLVLVGAEAEPPYDRPPLSKQLLRGETDSTTLEADWPALDVDLRLSTRALGVGDHVLTTDRGELPFDRLVLATGAQPRRLPGADHALTLRTRADALELRAAIRPGARLVIVGAGWIGAEVATAAAAVGTAVTVVEGLEAPLAGALPSDVGHRMLPWWSGVDLRLCARVSKVQNDAVTVVGGGRIAADLVLVAVGATPTVVDGVELTPEGAVAVDAQLRTSRPDVFAVGDCASWPSHRYGTRMLVEHWDNALHGPTAVAANCLGAADVWDPVPYFWSEQWGRMLQYAGHHPAGDHIVWREDGERWAAFWLAGNRLVSAVTVDRPRDLVQARRLMQRSGAVDGALLADPTVAVKDCAL
ncbi:MAG: FAD-dependent oxidoreductase [Sporichthyaceae bacterium]|nr:FAD-dependent oxidoreductase [Sporichthyaceae bacterium]